jgi:hypothetical protein
VIRRGAWIGVVLLALGCEREETPAPAPPAAPAIRGPAGEVPPNSRKVHDEGEAVAPAAPGYTYAFPGVPGTGTHYHLRIPDSGVPAAALAGGTTDRGLALRVYRAERVVDAALAVKAALAGAGAEILDPVTAGGCGDQGDHVRPDSLLRTPPPVRVVRARCAAAALPGWEAAVARVPGLKRVFASALGGDGKGEVVLDVHLVPQENR